LELGLAYPSNARSKQILRGELIIIEGFLSSHPSNPRF
jgi:hypothetical protein